MNTTLSPDGKDLLLHLHLKTTTLPIGEVAAYMPHERVFIFNRLVQLTKLYWQPLTPYPIGNYSV